MEPREEPRSLGRLRWVVRITLAWAVVVVLRLIQLQVVAHKEYLRQADVQQIRQVEIPAPRGAILDRSGNPLAMSVPVDSVCVNPLRVPDIAVAVEIFSRILNLDGKVLRLRLEKALISPRNRGFLWIKRKVSQEEAERLKSLHLEWIEFRKESKREYPAGMLASHVVGGVDHEEKGNAGLEQSMDEELRGTPGTVRATRDVRRRIFSSHVEEEAVEGRTITLSIDERIQFVAERELKAAVLGDRCTTGSLAVMDPHSGEILALANYPTFDPNEPVEPGRDLSPRFNLAISTPCEPGSVFKVFTLAAALETTSLRPDTMINCGGGTLNLFGRIIHEAKGGYGSLSMADVLAKSSNIGAIQCGMRVGEARLLEYLRRFGFGKPTGIPLPAESPGMVRDLRHWQKSSIGSVAMGHEISTTTLQLAQACSVIANGGLMATPRLILRMQRAGEAAEAPPVLAPRRILRPETAFAMRRMMEGVILHGTGKKARLPGYTAGGKTGSAQIFDHQTRQYTHRYNASFMGMAPLTKPAVVVVITLNGSSQFGGAVAAPVFREVAAAALRILGVPKDVPEAPEPEAREAEDDNDLAIPPESLPAPDLLQAGAQGPGPDAAAADDRIYVGPTVPDFQGKTLRAVLEESSAKGLPVEVLGSGIARAQIPNPGSVLAAGERIRVQFAR